MNEILSRIVADLFEKTKGGEELSSKIHRLRDEIRKVVESEDTIYGKLRGLVESLREIIPDEKQRYNAAMKALSTTSKLSRNEIVKAVNNQLEELKILEKGLIPALPNWRDELKARDARLQEARAEIAKLREVISRLESEEQGILDYTAARNKEIQLAEKAMRDLFTDIGSEITSVKTKVHEFTAERAVAPPSPPQPMPAQAIPPLTIPPQPIWPGDSMKSDAPVGKKGSDVHSSEAPQVFSEPQYSESQKNCPMCGIRMEPYNNNSMWRCFSCAHEEVRETKKSIAQKNETLEFFSPQEQQDTEWQKKCPMCGGRMDFYRNENMWRCFSCAYESEDGEVKDTNDPAKAAESSSAPEMKSKQPPSYVAPLASTPSSDNHRTKTGSPPAEDLPSSKKKTCPVCRMKMQWYPADNAWRCSFCDYERRI